MKKYRLSVVFALVVSSSTASAFCFNSAKPANFMMSPSHAYKPWTAAYAQHTWPAYQRAYGAYPMQPMMSMPYYNQQMNFQQVRQMMEAQQRMKSLNTQR